MSKLAVNFISIYFCHFSFFFKRSFVVDSFKFVRVVFFSVFLHKCIQFELTIIEMVFFRRFLRVFFPWNLRWSIFYRASNLREETGVWWWWWFVILLMNNTYQVWNGGHKKAIIETLKLALLRESEREREIRHIFNCDTNQNTLICVKKKESEWVNEQDDNDVDDD